MATTVSRYYKQPEGHDIVGKMYYALTRSTLAAGVICTADLVHIRPKTLSATVGRVWLVGWPILAIPSAFVSTVYISTNLRQKDDVWNYVLGGIAAGAVFGTWVRKPSVGAVVGGAFAVMAAIKKTAVQNNYTLFPNFRAVVASEYSPYYDWTLTRDIPGNWTTGRKD